jgi:hypothetical protein
MIDRKLEPLIKRLMTKHLGELDDDDLVMFVVEHLKDHKGPQKLVEGLEPVRRRRLMPTSRTNTSGCRSWRKRPPNLRLVFGDK